MRNLVIGDVHGHFKNLRTLLLEQGAINESNERINKDTLKVYCTGDLIDGGVNRMGDFLLLDYIEEWFDEVVIGNHEYSFLGGPQFHGLRMHDRPFQLKLLELEERGIYVPATKVNDYLLVHAGLSNRWNFKTVDEALSVIKLSWDTVQDLTDEMPVLDWIGSMRAPKFGDPVGGIFWLDWDEPRNILISQVVGHSTRLDGPIVKRYLNGSVEHWNIDVGGKFGVGLGGIIIEEGEPTIPVFSGGRYFPKEEKFINPHADDELEWEYIEPLEDWDDIDSEEALKEFKELMETH